MEEEEEEERMRWLGGRGGRRTMRGHLPPFPTSTSFAGRGENGDGDMRWWSRRRWWKRGRRRRS